MHEMSKCGFLKAVMRTCPEHFTWRSGSGVTASTSSLPRVVNSIPCLRDMLLRYTVF